MKFIKTAFCFILCAFLLVGCSFAMEDVNSVVETVKPITLSGEMKTETILPSDNVPVSSLDFEKMAFTNVRGKAKITVVPSDEVKVVATYPSDIVDYGFEITIRNGNINIAVPKERNFVAENFEITVYANIDEIFASGGIEMEVNAAGAREMEVEIIGATSLYMYGLDVEELSMEVKGAASMDISGSAREAEIDLNGAGAIDAKNLVCKKAEVRISGAGSAELSITHELIADIDGIGALDYYGDPKVQNISGGLASIEQVSKEVYGG